MSNAATVGVRSSWTCELCQGKQTAYQVVKADALESIEAPFGWTRTYTGRVFCDRHPTEARIAKEQENGLLLTR